MTTTGRPELWSAEDKDRIRNMWMVQGMSATEITFEFPGKSRNAIIGVVHRLGLSGQRNGGKRMPSTRPRPEPRMRTRVRAPVVAPLADAPAAEQHVVGLHAVSYDDLRAHHCRFPLGEKPYKYCGDPIVEGAESYCAYHQRVCYVPPSVRRQVSADKNSMWHARRAR